MEAPEHTIYRQRKWTRLWWIFGILAVVAILVVIIVPLAVILPRRHHSQGLISTVLVPLYIYPVSDAWEPLYEVLVSHPSLNFTLVVNPDNGPGSSQYPGDDYISGILQLNTYSNVRTVGYVRTGYGSRNVTSVLGDIATYSGWSTYTSNGTSLAVHGIFLDEFPYEYSSEIAEYQTTLNQAVKNASGLQQSRMVIHNPGTIPDARLDDPSTDVTIAFEDSYQAYSDQQQSLTSLPLDRSRYGFVLHSVPTSTNLKGLVDQMSQHAEYLFVTDLSKDYYESFGKDWNSFVDVMPT